MNGAIEAAQFEPGSRHRIQYVMLTDITPLTPALILCAPYFIRFMTATTNDWTDNVKPKENARIDLIYKEIEKDVDFDDGKSKVVENVIVVDASWMFVSILFRGVLAS